MPDIKSQADIDLLVRRFYSDLLESEIAYIFTDVAKIDLEEHLPHISNFWSSILLGTENYRGGAMGVHFRLAEKTPLTKETFKVWLELFDKNVDALFEGPIAAEAKSRAHSIGALMEHRVNSGNGIR